MFKMKFFYFIINFIVQFFLTLVLGTTVSDVHIKSKKQKKLIATIRILLLIYIVIVVFYTSYYLISKQSFTIN